MQTAVITGASRGIGRAVAANLAGDYHIINLSRTNCDGHQNYNVDIGDYEQVRTAFEHIVQQIGTPNILINCAGTVEPQGILEITPSLWQDQLATNLSGIFFTTQQFVKYAKHSGGKIVNIASTAGTRAQPGWSAYAAAKAGVINFSLSMAEELRQYRIKVYCVCPGRCATDLRQKLAPLEDQSTIMQPDDLAGFIGYLIRQGDLIDGQPIIVREGGVPWGKSSIL